MDQETLNAGGTHGAVPEQTDENIRRFVGYVAELVSLSPREAQVLLFLAQGRGSKEIASELDRYPTTINTFFLRLCRKMGCRTRIEAMAALLRLALSLHSYEGHSTPENRSNGGAVFSKEGGA